MRAKRAKKTLKYLAMGLVIAALGYAVVAGSKKSPEQLQLEKEVSEVSLEGKVEEYAIEGREHVPAGSRVTYGTNPPTSGSHLAEAEKWGIYGEEVDELKAVHSLEHGGVWISYKDLSEEERQQLEEIGRSNPGSTLVSPRAANDTRIAVASWGRMMKLNEVDTALIQKYIETYINDSPEKLAK